jgi:multicomponent Na+:H+ antiporter subunit E
LSRYAVRLGLVLVVLWLLFSGLWTHTVVVPLGIASIALTIFIAWRLGIIDRDADPVHLIIPSLKYLPWLMWQMVRANLTVARCILSGNGTLSPHVARLRTSQRSDLGRSIMANSITITPGTVTLEVFPDEIEYYALTAEMVRELEAGEMDRRVSNLEQEL